jgi:hypothetical protein
MTTKKMSRFKVPLVLNRVELPSEDSERTLSDKGTDIRCVARKALLQLFEPLAGFVLDSGLSAVELQFILRQAIVRGLAAKQIECGRRINISGIAASTGISRAEISRILQNARDPKVPTDDLKQQSTNRILAAWHQSPRFTNPNGHAADLKIYGSGATFESLVKKHGGGIPTRAMLDELARTGAIEVLPFQKVRAKTSVAVDGGISPRAVRAFGNRAAELLSTMLLNMRNPDRARFIASASSTSVFPDALPLIRKMVSKKGADFVAEIQDDLLTGPPALRASRNAPAPQRVSVTVFYHEESRTKVSEKSATTVRRNFRRRV